MGDDCQYYIPDSDASDEDRETMIRQAVNDGADVIVCVGYLYGASLAWAAEQYPDVKFIAIDVTQGDIGTDSIPANCYCITFKEEQAGYLAGYAVVKDGYTKLGFLGGMAVPAVIRYGYGYVQGADAAAKELGTNIDINYFYGGQFYGDANITSRMEGWYSNGTEIVFACGGSMFQSVVAAASAEDGKVVGVDVDQSSESETVVTSAMKGLSDAAEWAIAKVYDGTWDEIGNAATSLGVAENAVGLPTATWSMENFSVADYEDLFQKVLNGDITIDNNSEMADPSTAGLSNVNVNYIGG